MVYQLSVEAAEGETTLKLIATGHSSEISSIWDIINKALTKVDSTGYIDIVPITEECSG